MANIIVDETQKSVTMNFGDTVGYFGKRKMIYRKENVHFELFDTYIFMAMEPDMEIFLSVDGNSTVTPTFIVDMVGNKVPTDLADLYTKLKALLG